MKRATSFDEVNGRPDAAPAMSEPSRLVIVGASLAGLRAAEAARRSGFAGTVTLVGAEEHLPYDRPPLSKEYLDASPREALTFRDRNHLTGELGVELRLGTRAQALDDEAKVIATDAGDVPFDALVIATGARARVLPNTSRLAGVHVLRTLDDAIALREALDAGARVAIIGAGFIGSEIASSARKRGLEVTIVEAQPTPLERSIGARLGTAISSLHERNGTRLVCGRAVESLAGDDRVTGVRLTGGETIPADLVVVGIGAIPETEWLRGSGVQIDDGVICDASLATSVPGIYAAGDVASWHNPTMGRRQRLEHWSSAAEQGAVAARNAVSPATAREYGTVPYFWSDWYDHRIQFVGAPDADEVVVVDGDPDCDNRWTALYRGGDRLVGALTLNGQNVIMKYRAQIMRGRSWDEALEFARHRRGMVSSA